MIWLSAERDTPRCSAARAKLAQHLGGIDILINVVGGSSAPAGGFAALDDSEWSKELDQNLMSAVRLDRALLHAMIAQRSGVVIHVTSIQRVLPMSPSIGSATLVLGPGEARHARLQSQRSVRAT